MNNPKDMLVSDERMYKRDPEPRQDSKEWSLWYLRQIEGPRGLTREQVRDLYEAELTKLRSERDELVGALRATWNALEASPCDPDITADQIAAHAEMNKHNVPALLAKHRPE